MFTSIFYTGPSLQTLHDDYAKKGRIDKKAGVQSSCAMEIQAPVEVVWGLLSDLQSWHTWFPAVTDVRLESGVVTDAAFSWKNGPSKIKSTFAVVDSGKELTWTGVSAGAKAIDRHVLQPIDGGTRIFTEESMSGPLLGLFFNSQKLRNGQVALLNALKRAAEDQVSR